jgi:hypothetical protein
MATGRYAAAPIVTTTVTDAAQGAREVRYLGRRTLPDPRHARALALHVVTLADRLDLVAAEHLGDPLAAWQIADANLALDPFQLTAFDAEGDVLVVPFPDAAP